MAPRVTTSFASTSDYDPLSIAWAPPPDESPEARNERLQQEAAAQKVSDAIDESLRQEKAAMSKRKQPVKILLLGQAESGESTFRLGLWFPVTVGARDWLCTSDGL